MRDFETLANSRDMKIGDRLTIRLPDDEKAAMYAWGDKMSGRNPYGCGIVSYHPDYRLNVYTPSLSDSARPVRYFYNLGQATLKTAQWMHFFLKLRSCFPSAYLLPFTIRAIRLQRMR